MGSTLGSPCCEEVCEAEKPATLGRRHWSDGEFEVNLSTLEFHADDDYPDDLRISGAEPPDLESAGPSLGPAESFHSSELGDDIGQSEVITGSARLQGGRFSETDWRILRGTSLRHTLRQGGILWRRKPADMSVERRAALYERSNPVESFDFFVSHTWMTRGRLKVTALLIQFGTAPVLGIWAFTVALMTALCMTDVLPLPFTYHGDPLGCWVLFGGLLATVLGFAAYPHLPNLCSRSDVCFLDCACIHQTERDQMRRGIYGIAGFLRVSKEMHILWTPPYLTRLWCVFELAGYRKVNPNGKIIFKPLFFEYAVGLLLMGEWPFVISLWAITDPQYLNFVYAGFFFCGFLHIRWLRRCFSAKHALIRELETFELANADCLLDFDRIFIHSAIKKWYGSVAHFEAFVRGPLREDLLRSLSVTRIPWRYMFLLATPHVSVSVEFVMTRWKSGDSTEAVWSHIMAVVLGLDLFISPALACLFMQLGETFAEPCGSRCLDLLHTLWITALIGGIMFSIWILSEWARESFLPAAIYVTGSMIFAVTVLRGGELWTYLRSLKSRN